MDQATLEQKLRSAKKTIEGILDNRELEENDYYSRMHDILTTDGILDDKSSIESSKMARYISEHFIYCDDAITYHNGLQQNYVSLAKNPILCKKNKKDIEGFNSLQKIIEQYTRNTETSEVTERQFRYQALRDIGEHPLCKGIKDARRKYVISTILNKIVLEDDLNFKDKEDVRYGRYTSAEINEALQKMKL